VRVQRRAEPGAGRAEGIYRVIGHSPASSTRALAGAKRELREETGYEADRWEPLGRFVVDPNYGCGAMHAFMAHDARKVSAPDSGDLEEQELVIVPFREALAKLRSGEVAQQSTAAALGLAAIALGEGP
jgi:ADP-ribose pyrophosphatase